MPTTLPNVIIDTIIDPDDFNVVSDRAEWTGNTVEDMVGPMVDYTADYGDVWTSSGTVPDINSGQENYCWGRRPGKIIRIEFGLTMSGATSIGSGEYRFRFPLGIVQKTHPNSAFVSGVRGQALVIHTDADTVRRTYPCDIHIFASNYFTVNYRRGTSPYETITVGASNAPFVSGSWNDQSTISGWAEFEADEIP